VYEARRETQIIHRQGQRHNFDFLEFSTLGWLDGITNRCGLKTSQNIPPLEAEIRFYAQSAELALVASLK
jgi:putative transposase